MDYDITQLTFLDDPTTYQVASNERCASIPSGLSSGESLITSISEGLDWPMEKDEPWGIALWHAMMIWSREETASQRVVLLHHDLPKVNESPYNWVGSQNYLRMLIDLIGMLQEANAHNTDPTKHRELIAIFPTQMYEEIHATLFHPPLWNAIIGFPDFYVTSAWGATWPTVLDFLHTLNGLTAQTCRLDREDVGHIDVYYRKENATYFIEYYEPKKGWPEHIAILEEDLSSFTGLPLSLTEQVLETFFEQGKLSSAVQWLDTKTLSGEQWEILRGMRYYRTEEEALLNSNGGTIRNTIQEGVREAFVEQRMKAFTLDYWKEVLAQPDVDINLHLAALCIIGISDLPEASDLLRPFLKCSDKRERWVSACLIGMRQDNEVVPLLLSTLTDEMPLKREEGVPYDPIYDLWRPYAIRLLSLWLTPQVRDQLRKARAIWDEAVDEELFDPEYEIWTYTIEAIADTLWS